MKVACVVIGVGEWDRFTYPAVQSIVNTDKELDLVVVDNGSVPPYPNNMDVVRIEKTVCYAAALNYGMRAVDADWYVLLNNDILLNKSVSKRFQDLDPYYFYGFKMWDNKTDFPHPYLSGWCMLVSRQLYQGIGGFDENLSPMYFEDADYSVRAVRSGFPLVELDRDEWGIFHLQDERHGERKLYMIKHKEQRDRNREYLKGKHGL